MQKPSVHNNFDAVVVGSGFGGAVAACRLAQAGLNVAILERGRRYPRGSFPRNWQNLSDGWLWEHEQGLFDVKPINEMVIIQGAGYGGGSLIYANVQIRVPADALDHGWPTGYSRAALDPYYDLVAYMLDITPIGAHQPLGLPPKTMRMREAADRLGRGDQLCFPNLAVSFADPEQQHENKFGIEQFGCRHCGECDIGCNYSAKNTLDLNYLAVAEQHGAQVKTQSEVTQLAVAAAGGGYEVQYRNHENQTEERLTAPAVFLCAGAVNSTELLLRCRDQYGTLPNLSDALGRGYSGNGDFLAFAMHTDAPFEPWRGPTITSGLVFSKGADGDKRWTILQEGGVPREAAGLLQVLDQRHPGAALPFQLRDDVEREIKAAARERIGPGDDSGRDTAIFLAMGRDRANGRIRLLPLTYRLHVEWDLPSNRPLYDIEERLTADLARGLGGDITYNPLWHYLHQPGSVHNLGGCCMADDPQHGVTDGNGEVHSYPGLFVLDGACLPSATGVNPSHTIAAVAERNIETAIRRITTNTEWRAPERADAHSIHEPLDDVKIPADGTAPPTTPGLGVQFTETMRGYLHSTTITTGGDYIAAEDAGRRAGMILKFTVTVAAPSLDEFLASRHRPMTAIGTIRADGFTDVDGAPVRNGVVNLLVDGDSATARRMLYALPFYGTDGEPYLLDGYKDVRDHGRFDVWGSTTTLYTVIRAGHTRQGSIVATGLLHIHPGDFARQLLSARVTGTANPVLQVSAATRFGQMFGTALWDAFVRPRLPL